MRIVYNIIVHNAIVHKVIVYVVQAIAKHHLFEVNIILAFYSNEARNGTPGLDFNLGKYWVTTKITTKMEKMLEVNDLLEVVLGLLFLKNRSKHLCFKRHYANQ